MIISTNNTPLEEIIRDLKKHTSKTILRAIEENPQESRKEWMLWMLERAGKKNSNNSKYQFWQQHNQPEELSIVAFGIDSAIDYIHQNPVEAGFVNKSEEYLHSSATDFSGG